MTPTLYLAGPMTSIPQFNFPLFDSVAATLRGQGYTIISPAELDDPATRAAALASPDGNGIAAACGESYGDFLARDLKLILDEADGVALLPGWQKSTGACIEAFAARRQGKPLYEVKLAKEGFLSLEILDEGIAFHTEPSEVERYIGEADRAVVDEVRVTSDTGGQKGQKLERMDLIPWEPIWELARVYGFGAQKYDDHNYLKGFDWSLSYAAALRHLSQWINGEDHDPESDLHHLAHAAWHCFALMMYQWHGLGTDTRIPTATGIEPQTITRTGRSEAVRKPDAPVPVPNQTEGGSRPGV